MERRDNRSCKRKKENKYRKNKRILPSCKSARLICPRYPEGYVLMTVFYKNKSFYLFCEDASTRERQQDGLTGRPRMLFNAVPFV
jgi:hypothetical protein